MRGGPDVEGVDVESPETQPGEDRRVEPDRVVEVRKIGDDIDVSRALSDRSNRKTS